MRIWTGRAGSGKTTAILQEIAALCARDEGRQILLVPELNSHQMERHLAAATGNHGARTAEVLTFFAPCRPCVLRGGRAGAADAHPGGTAADPAGGRAPRAGRPFRVEGLADKPELLREALRLVDECKTCAVAPEALFAASEECEDAALAAKLGDLAQLLTAYERLCDESLPDPRDRLTHLRDRLADSHVLDGAAVYLDGFLGFTPQELAVVDAMLAAGVPLAAAVTCDMAYPEIFVTGCKTVKTLTRMAKRHNRTAEQIDLGAGRIARPAGLAAIEQESLLPVRTAHEDARGVRLYAAASPFDECEHAAAYIRRKVRDEGARYRDFVVCCARYRAVQRHARDGDGTVRRAGVPREKPDLLSRPPMAMVVGALAAAESYFQYEDLFGCLKTGLTSLTRDEVDKLENYVLTWNIRGGAWERGLDRASGRLRPAV